ncbi:protein kinase, partial [bacterium]|nr:protein kinase [bacterium]
MTPERAAENEAEITTPPPDPFGATLTSAPRPAHLPTPSATEATVTPLIPPTPPPVPFPAAGIGAGPVAFGRYELLDEIARGGMGVVYRARQQGLDRLVALKMVLGVGSADDLAGQRFLQEARTAAAIDHPNVVPIYDTGEVDGRLFFTMALVDGPNLRSYVRDRGRLTTAEAVGLFTQIVAGVAHAHRAGIIHRDLKPANVLMDPDGRPRVTDFGLAKKSAGSTELTATGQVVGTPAYMAPEQARESKDAGPAADVYALGAILFFLLTGRPPFEGETSTDLLIKVVMEAPPSPREFNPDVPDDVEHVCLRCLEKNPADRFPDAQALAEMAVALAEKYVTLSATHIALPGSRGSLALTPTSLSVVMPGTAERPAPPSKRSLTAGLVAAAVVLGGLTVFLATRGKKAEPEVAANPEPPPAAAQQPPQPPADPVIPPPARTDFGLTVGLVAAAAQKDSSGVIRMTAGVPMQLHLKAAKDCRAAVWVIDPSGEATRIFPNDNEPDDRLVAGQERVIPGNDSYVLDTTLTVGDGAERLRVLASTGDLPPYPVGAKAGRFTVVSSADERAQLVSTLRGVAVKRVNP